MNLSRHSFLPEIESNIHRHKLERQVSSIVLGLTLITGGNGIALINSGETDTRNEAASDSDHLSDMDKALKVSDVSSADSKAIKVGSSIIVPETTPSTETLLEPSVVPAPFLSPKPSVLAKPAPPPSAKLNVKPPVMSMKKKTAGFSPAEIRPMSDITKNNLDKMELSAERYEHIVNTIDSSHLNFAQEYTPFNPDKVAIEQRQTEFFTLHFTAFYSNFGESSKTEPAGDMDVRKLINTMGSRGDVCCGVNWLLDRNGKIYQTAPVAAKLRHNPPFDSITTGVEVEASDQDAVTPFQYETLTYLTIAVLKHQGLLDRELSEVIHGHGEDRDKYRKDNPETKWETRNDFDAQVSDYFRSKVALFLGQNPDIKNVAVPFG